MRAVRLDVVDVEHRAVRLVAGQQPALLVDLHRLPVALHAGGRERGRDHRVRGVGDVDDRGAGLAVHVRAVACTRRARGSAAPATWPCDDQVAADVAVVALQPGLRHVAAAAGRARRGLDPRIALALEGRRGRRAACTAAAGAGDRHRRGSAHAGAHDRCRTGRGRACAAAAGAAAVCGAAGSCARRRRSAVARAGGGVPAGGVPPGAGALFPPQPSQHPRASKPNGRKQRMRLRLITEISSEPQGVPRVTTMESGWAIVWVGQSLAVSGHRRCGPRLALAPSRARLPSHERSPVRA